MTELIKDLITVVIPAYNAASYIEKCLNSVLKQTYKELEVIVVNDCSTDNTAEKIAEFSDKRLRLINLPENHGQSYVRNLGIREARGEFVGFIDSDDFVDENYYELLHEKSLSSGADISLAETRLVRVNGVVSENNNFIKEETLFFNKFSLFPHGGIWDKLFRTAFLRDNNLYFPEGYIWEDNLYCLKAAYYANKIATVRGCYYNYIKNDFSTTRSVEKKIKRQKDCIYIAKEMIDFMNENKFKSREKNLVINFILTHMVRKEILEDKQCAKTLKQTLGRLEIIKQAAKKHNFYFSLRRKKLIVLGMTIWDAGQ